MTSPFYSFLGPVPPSPVVVDTLPEYFGGRPTPPSSPLRAHATVDDYAPCPPTPQCVPSDVEQDESEWSNASNSASPTEPRDYWTISELDHSTSFADPLGDHAQRDDPLAVREPPIVSDHIIYAREIYSWPCPVLGIMQRASLDLYGLQTQPINLWGSGEPLRLFSLTGGHVPMTGLNDLDRQSFEYYTKIPLQSPLRVPEYFLSYRYSIRSIEAVQRSLYTKWSSVYPRPIPPVIIRSRDLIGPHSLSRRDEGFAFVVPSQDSIWATILQRGIDLDYRPLDPSLTIETCMCQMGEAFYYPQHIVASKIAVNVFLEVSDSATRSNPLCEYLGAYVIQVIEGLTISPATWADIHPAVQQSVYNRAPDCFAIHKHPSFGWPQLPCVQFFYYKWDGNIVGLADESRDRGILTATQGIPRRGRVGHSNHASGLDSAHSPGQNHVSFLYF